MCSHAVESGWHSMAPKPRRQESADSSLLVTIHWGQARIPTARRGRDRRVLNVEAPTTAPPLPLLILIYSHPILRRRRHTDTSDIFQHLNLPTQTLLLHFLPFPHSAPFSQTLKRSQRRSLNCVASSVHHQHTPQAPLKDPPSCSLH